MESIMSNVSNAHNVNKFISGKSEALTGQRLAKVTYKSTKNNPAKYPSICASVPYINNQDIIDNVDNLVPYIKVMLENAQDGIIRSLYESADGNLTTVTNEDISIAQCINYLSAESQGSRLTKEYLSQWFTDNIEETLTYTFAVKLGFISANEEDPVITDNQQVTLHKHINGYRDLISSLSGGKTILQDNQIKSIRKAVELSGVNDDISIKLINRLNTMENKPKIEELLDL
jgi:hypothetical protein